MQAKFMRISMFFPMLQHMFDDCFPMLFRVFKHFVWSKREEGTMDQTHSSLGISRTCRNEHTWGMATKKCTVVLACSSTYVFFSEQWSVAHHKSSVSKVVKNQVSSQSMDQAGKGASTCYWF